MLNNQFKIALAKVLKSYGFRNASSITKQIIKSTESEYIPYSTYKTMFRSILNTSKSFTWDIEVGTLYDYKNIPLKKSNPFFIKVEEHIKGSKSNRYEISYVLQKLLNVSWDTAISNTNFKHSEISEFDFTIPLNVFHTIKEKDKRILLKVIKGTNKGNLVFENIPKGTYRKFSTFTRLSQETRGLTEFDNSYDIQSGLQSLMLNFYANLKGISFNDTKDIFPLFWNYVNDKADSRKQIAEIHNQSIQDVKTIITSITYGGLIQQYNYNTLPSIYTEFFKENQILSDFVYNNINQITDTDFQTYLNDKILNKEKGKKEKNIVIYTFMEYYEKLIRDILIEQRPINSRYQEVHDAMYCTDKIDINNTKTIIFDRLNFFIDFD